MSCSKLGRIQTPPAWGEAGGVILMPGLGHHAAKAVPSDKSRVGAGVGADLDRSGVRRQQQAAAVGLPDPALGLCKNHSKDRQCMPAPVWK